ncbi:putative oxidoreductase [Albidovulum inexpectatum]|uniref:Putative oxidoreductase n=1 Tax=Albidovulum inexpectatum TaxID=196587 RepID=A0A2S5JFA8_9RHOB|nr:DoxX family protein [Albidovulum inexpectatum]PPB80172.1 putative oxidoreductase [Albidovulum inexpectatum]
MIALYRRAAGLLDQIAPRALPLAARIVFAGVLLFYFWGSAVTKLGPGVPGLWTPSDGAYIQVLPKVVESVGYDFSQLGLLHRLIVLAGTWAELILPALIVLGLLTRLAALGMIGFVTVQSLTDIWGHGVAGADLGQWFDRASDALILDQRAFWMLLFMILVMHGGGWLSLDRVLTRRKDDRRF